MWKIRQAVDNDRTRVKDIVHLTIESVYPRYYPKGAVDFFLAHHNNANIQADIYDGKVFLLEKAGAPVGTVTTDKDELCRLFVLPDFQGCGFGTALLDFAEHRISQTYDSTLVHSSLPAKTIYLKRGYLFVSSHAILTDSGDYLCYDIMRKQQTCQQKMDEDENLQCRAN